MEAVLGRSWGHCGQSWAALGALEGLKGAIFSENIDLFFRKVLISRTGARKIRSWRPRGRNWNDLGRSVGGLALLLGLLWAV